MGSSPPELYGQADVIDHEAVYGGGYSRLANGR